MKLKIIENTNLEEFHNQINEFSELLSPDEEIIDIDFSTKRSEEIIRVGVGTVGSFYTEQNVEKLVAVIKYKRKE